MKHCARTRSHITHCNMIDVVPFDLFVIAIFSIILELYCFESSSLSRSSTSTTVVLLRAQFAEYRRYEMFLESRKRPFSLLWSVESNERADAVVDELLGSLASLVGVEQRCDCPASNPRALLIVSHRLLTTEKCQDDLTVALDTKQCAVVALRAGNSMHDRLQHRFMFIRHLDGPAKH